MKFFNKIFLSLIPCFLFLLMSLWVDKYRPSDFSALSIHHEASAMLKDLVNNTMFFYFCLRIKIFRHIIQTYLIFWYMVLLVLERWLEFVCYLRKFLILLFQKYKLIGYSLKTLFFDLDKIWGKNIFNAIWKKDWYCSIFQQFSCWNYS